MNYNCVIIVGIVVLIAVWWVLHANKHYEMPHLKMAVDHNT